MPFGSAALLAALSVPAHAQDYQAAAQEIVPLMNDYYAYLERLPDGTYTPPPKLQDAIDAVQTSRDLLRVSEKALFLLADHHAITGGSFSDSWAVFPSYGDMWIDYAGGEYVIAQVREGSPAAGMSIQSGDRLVIIGGERIEDAVAAFWSDLGAQLTDERRAFAARVIAAGRRDRPREMVIAAEDGRARVLALPNLYSIDRPQRPPVTATPTADGLHIRFNDSLGNNATIAAFDEAMAQADPAMPVILDLTDTPSGGNTTVARGIMGWFVSEPTPYQMHSLPAEQRAYGVERQWIELVKPREGMRHTGPVSVRVGRWTGSMGEGLAIGFSHIGAEVTGTQMAGLLGAIYDMELGDTGMIVKIPVERLYRPDGLPREDFVPAMP